MTGRREEGVGICLFVCFPCVLEHMYGFWCRECDLCKQDLHTIIGFNVVCRLSGEIKANEM